MFAAEFTDGVNGFLSDSIQEAQRLSEKHDDGMKLAVDTDYNDVNALPRSLDSKYIQLLTFFSVLQNEDFRVPSYTSSYHSLLVGE